MKGRITWIFISILIIFALLFVWFLNSLSKPKIPQKTEEEVKALDLQKLEKLENLKHPGESVRLDEPGYGREDPFVPY